MPQYGISSGLVGYWTFDTRNIVWTSATAATTIDISGNNNGGTLTNMSKATSPAIGKMGQALSFDGVNDYVDAGNQASLQITGAMTIAFWLNGDGKDAFTEGMVSKLGASRGYQVGFFNNGSGFFRIASNISTLVTLTLGSHTANIWEHWVCIYIPSTSMTCFKNGNQVYQTTTSIPASQYSASNNLRIGTRADETGTMIGKLDDIRIYNRALSASEVKQLYRMGK